jgi:CheY-like chemotaxis protein
MVCANLGAYLGRTCFDLQSCCCGLLGDDALTLIQSVHESFSVSSDVKEQKPGGSADGLKCHVDIMLLDIRMPGKSGLDVMQEAPRPLPFPVVAMTGNVDKESLEEYKCVCVHAFDGLFQPLQLSCYEVLNLYPGGLGSLVVLVNRLRRK